MNKNEDAELISKAKATAVKHMKDKYGLDVEMKLLMQKKCQLMWFIK
ncbi:hypothetical protein [Paenibacillus sp. IHB B 3084]|nr:hypothetical protein [Paenibacillus sp. IHB B 3084]